MLTPKIHPVRVALLFAIALPMVYFLSEGMRWDNELPVGFAVLLGGLTLSPLLAMFGSPGWQFVVRGAWMSGVCWSALVTFFAYGDWADWHKPLLCLLGFGAMIFIAGGSGLRRTDEPVRFRKTLATSMLFGFGDFATLALLTAIVGHEALTSPRPEWLFLTFSVSSALFLGISLWGLLRMKVWGLFLCITMNIVVVLWMTTGALDLPDPIAALFVTTAVIQMLLPIPLIVAMFKGRRSPALQS